MTRALVLGGGIGGLVTARVLSDFFDEVKIVEKDQACGAAVPRSGAAQGAHLHVLLQKGQELLGGLFKGIEEDFRAAGCPRIDWAADTFWETKLGAFPRYPSSTLTTSFSRPFLESVLHKRISTIPRIGFQHAYAEQLVIENGRASSLRCLDGSEIEADFFVLAGGQRLPLSRLLGRPSLDRHTESHPIHITYRSLLFQANSLAMTGYKQYYYQFTPPHDPIGAVICPVENGRAIATIVEYGPAPGGALSMAAFFEKARAVPGGEFFRIIEKGLPLGEVSVFHKASMQLRRLGRASELPENCFVAGDAFCSLNPVFGQGMTTALLQASLLQRQLGSGDFSSRRFHRKSEALLRLPHLLSRLGSSVENKFSNRYLREYTASCRSSERLHRNFLSVLHLKGGYSNLLAPAALGRSLLSRSATT